MKLIGFLLVGGQRLPLEWNNGNINVNGEPLESDGEWLTYADACKYCFDTYRAWNGVRIQMTIPALDAMMGA